MSGELACSQWSRRVWQRARGRATVAGIADGVDCDPRQSTASISRCVPLRLECAGVEEAEDVGGPSRHGGAGPGCRWPRRRRSNGDGSARAPVDLREERAERAREKGESERPTRGNAQVPALILPASL
jgi:hypothetical protein